mmetsp:Transcript_23134/g.44325  ORF Transcript_23134/g.44325 Transcript_23134/m.44325 type:complete len:86 (-) Transcript_23134:45-302(-)
MVTEGATSNRETPPQSPVWHVAPACNKLYKNRRLPFCRIPDFRWLLPNGATQCKPMHQMIADYCRSLVVRAALLGEDSGAVPPIS